jgi:hypothetical protein
MLRNVQQFLDTLASSRNKTMSARVRECIYTMLLGCSASEWRARAAPTHGPCKEA